MLFGLNFGLGGQASNGRAKGTMLFSELSQSGYVGYSSFEADKFGELRGANPLPSNPMLALMKLPDDATYAVFQGDAVTTLNRSEIVLGETTAAPSEADSLNYNAGTGRTTALFSEGPLTIEPDTLYPVSVNIRPGIELQAAFAGGGSFAVTGRLKQKLGAVFAGGGQFLANARITKKLAAVFAGGGSMSALMRVRRNLAATFSGGGTMSGNIAVGGPAVSFIAYSEAESGGAITFNSPSSVQVGDLLITTLTTQGNDPASVPSGWTRLTSIDNGFGASPTGIRIVHAWKIATVAGAQSIAWADCGDYQYAACNVFRNATLAVGVSSVANAAANRYIDSSAGAVGPFATRDMALFHFTWTGAWPGGVDLTDTLAQWNTKAQRLQVINPHTVAFTAKPNAAGNATGLRGDVFSTRPNRIGSLIKIS